MQSLHITAFPMNVNANGFPVTLCETIVRNRQNNVKCAN